MRTPDLPNLPGDIDLPELPDIEFPNADPLGMFETLHADTPLLMLPVRLETRFYHDPDRLRIRIYPDQIHINNHQAALSEREAELGQRFWQLVWDKRGKKSTHVFEKLAKTLGIWRATWVMEATTPTNIDAIGSGKPIFPSLDTGHVATIPARLDLLPNRWIAIGKLNNETVFVEVGEQIPRNIRFAPFQMNGPDDLDRWTVDFEAAKRVGMAIEVRLTGKKKPVIDDGLDELIVVGGRFGSPEVLAQSLEETLQAHYYTRGFDFVPQGTPTNNTESLRSPWRWESADAAGVLEHAWQPTTPLANSHRERFAQALGMDENGIVARALQGSTLDIPAMEAMNHALWYTMWGEYLHSVLSDGQQSPVPVTSMDWLRDWFIDHVRGGAPLPAFHVGSMPYGILPIQLLPTPLDANSTEQYLQWVVADLRAGWERSLPNVPILDPTATASATDAPITLDLEAANDNLIAILSSHPHPVAFYTRILENLRTIPWLSLFLDPIDVYEGQKNALVEKINGVDALWSSELEDTLRIPFASLADQTQSFQNVLSEASTRLNGLRQELQNWEDTLGTIIPPDFVDIIKNLVADIETHEAIEQNVETILTLLSSHSKRVYPINTVRTLPVMDVLSLETLNPEHFYFIYRETDSAWGDLPLVQAVDAQEGAQAAVYLDWLKDYARGTASGTAPAGISDPAPLLFQLLKSSIDKANTWDNSLLFELDQFLGVIDRLSGVTSKATRMSEAERLINNEHQRTSITTLLTQALQAPGKDPNRISVAAVPRTVFRNVAAQVREYVQVSRKTAASFDPLINVLDEWAGQPDSGGAFEAGWGGIDYLPTKAGPRVTQLANAIDVLAALTVEELELRLKETLGLAMHRLDAWMTAYAENRVNTLRVKNPAGIQIGGFGWVENLRPDEAGTSSSQGYIHAPSMTQAAAAAVLRSGYSAYSDGTATAPMSVDLRSDRVRTARWMMDGLRQGQTINELLGYRLERFLHDAFLDVWIDPVRQVVADHGTTEYAADRATAVVDGLALLELWDEGKGTLESLIQKPIGDTGKPLPFNQLLSALEHLIWITDSMADLALAESVHALVQGDYERASAVQNASAFGDVPPPEVRSVLTPNSGITITHRLLLMPQAGDHAWKNSPFSKRAQIEPALEAWAASVIGSPANIRYRVHGDITTSIEEASFENLPLSALDAIYLAPAQTEGSIASSPLGAWLALFYKESHPHNTSITIEADVEVGEGQISLADFILLANSIRQVLSAARPATPADFVPGDANTVEADTAAELQKRARDLINEFVGAVKAIEHPTGNLYNALIRLSFFNFPQAIPVSKSATALTSQAAALLRAAQSRRDEAQRKLARATANNPTNSTEQNICAARELIATVLGRDYPTMMRFPIPLSSGIIRDEAAVGVGDAQAVMGWLLKMARVQPDLVPLREMMTAAEILNDRPMFSFGVAQLPHVAGESWVGLARPSEEGADRLSLALTSNTDITTLNSNMGGLVLAQWVERIPTNYEMTGLSFHFDAPTSRPPQCLLLAVPPENTDWDFNLVVATVREAFARARLRAVAPETLGEYGHQIPAVYLSANLDMIGATDGE